MRVAEANSIVEDEVHIVIKQKDNKTRAIEKLNELDDLLMKKENKAGRKMQGKSLTKHKIAFYVDDEQLNYLNSLIVNGRGSKLKTENAVAKEIFLKDYEIHKESI